MNRPGFRFFETFYWVLIFGPALLFAKLFLNGQVLFWGLPLLQFVPWQTESYRQIADGFLPLWNTYSGMGSPLLANYQTAIFYPPNWVFLIFYLTGGAPGIAAADTISIFGHLVWAGAGMAVLARRLGCSRLGQVIAGLSFGMGGYLAARTSFFTMIWAGSWLPWLIWAASDIAAPGEKITGKKPIPIKLILIAAMQLLAGHAQLTWYSFLLVGIWCLVGGWNQGGFKTAFKAEMRLLAGILAAAGLAAVQLLPTAELLFQSQRSEGVDFNLAMTYSFWPWRFLTFLAPDLFGNPGLGNFWGYATYWEDAVYVGIIPLLLAGLSIAQVFRRNESAQQNIKTLPVFILAILFSGCLLALGKFTPVYSFLFKYIPTFEMFQSPARWMIWTCWGVSLLAASGEKKWRTPTGRGLYWTRLATAGMFAVTLGSFAAWTILQNINATFIRAAALTGLWGLGSGLLTLFHPENGQKFRKIWEWCVILWLGLDLLVASWALLPGVSPEIYTENSRSLMPVEQKLNGQRVYIAPSEDYSLKYRRFLSFKDFTISEQVTAIRQVMIPDLNLLERIPSANHYDPLLPGRYQKMMALIADLRPEKRADWLKRMGVGAVERISASSETGVIFETIHGASRLTWNNCILPASSPETAWDLIRKDMHKTGPGRRPVIETAALYPEECVSGSNASLKIVDDVPDKLLIQVDAPSAGWLVVADTWYPGWEGTIDGEKVKIYPADGMFRGIFVPAGLHTVKMVYSPLSFYFGAGISLITALLMILSTILHPTR